MVIMAGPCAIESEKQAMTIAEQVVKSGAHIFRGGAFKPRTSPYSFQGLGEKGLQILAKVRAETGMPVVTEVMDFQTFDIVEEYTDIIQIGTRNMQNFSLLRRAGKAGKPVLLKRGMAATIQEWLMAAEYILEEGNPQVILCERGVRTFVNHSRNTLDISAIPVVKKESHLPIIVDPSHAAGIRDQVEPLSLAAAAVQAHGLMIEVHHAPEEALSDGAQSLYPEQFDELCRKNTVHTVFNECIKRYPPVCRGITSSPDTGTHQLDSERDMDALMTPIVITKTNACPIYRAEEFFILEGNALMPPPEKPVCLILAADIRRLLQHSADAEEKTPIPFHCSGCTGTVSLEYRHEVSLQSESGQSRHVENIAKILSNFSMFQSIDQFQIRKLVKLLKLTQFSPGDFIIRKGDPGKNLFIILSGTVEVLGDDNVRIAELKKGEVFGEMSLLSGDPVGANIKVKEEAKVLYLQSRDFRRVLHKFPTLQLYLAKLLSKRLARTNIDKFSKDNAGISGTLSDTPPPEICQTINMNQKTGVLTLHLAGGDATISFRDGDIVKAQYGNRTGRDAFFEILKDNEGHFSFHAGLPAEEMEMRELGHFMCLLMEGGQQSG